MDAAPVMSWAAETIHPCPQPFNACQPSRPSNLLRRHTHFTFTLDSLLAVLLIRQRGGRWSPGPLGGTAGESSHFHSLGPR